MPLSSSARTASLRLALALAALASAASGCGSGSSGPGPGPAPTCTLPQAGALSVVEVVPADDATGVFVNANVSVRFNTCLDAASIGSATVLLVAGASPVARTLHHDVATATLVIDPSATLAYSQLHALLVSGVRGAHGETMTVFGSSFTTQGAPEYVPPTTTASPAGGRYDTPQSVTLTCTDNPGGTGCAGTRYTLDGSAPTPLSPLYAAPISITADAVLRFFSVDAQGNAETPKQETYVIDTVPPTLTASDPAHGATGVVLTKVLAATFSEDMDPDTLGEGSVSADHGLTFTFAWDAPTRTLVLTPTERLACGTAYQVSIGAGATDVAGNALVQPASFAFTTLADCEEPVTTASLAGGVFTSSPQSVTLTCTDTGGSGCARIVYTTDGSIPTLVPPHGTVVTGASAGPIAVGEGDTKLRWFAEDAAGNREALKEQRYSVSTTGFTFVATDGGMARGVGPVPAQLEPLLPGGLSHVFVRDPSNGRLYRGTSRGLLVSDGGEAFTHLPGSPTGVLSVLPLGSKIFAGTSDGLFASLDGGATFVERELPPGCRAAHSCPYVRAVVAEGQDVWAATDLGVAFSSDRGHSFVFRTTSDGLGSDDVTDLVLAGGTLYAATSAGVARSVDGGQSFSNSTSGLGSPSVNALVVSGSTVYAATDGGLSISYDGGATFTVTRTTANGLGSNYVGALAFDGARLYACTGEPWVSGTADSFSVSTDADGDTFVPRALALFADSLRAQSVHVEGATVRVGAYPNYYLSTDGGSTFASMDLRGSVRKLAGAGGMLYAAISESSGHGGVAVSADRGRSFVVRNQDDGMPFHNVDDVAASGSNVYAATFWGLGLSTDGGDGFVEGALGGSVGCVWASGPTVWACEGGTLQLSVNSGTSFEQRLSGAGGGGAAVAVHGANVYHSTTSGLWVSNTAGAAGSFTPRGAADGLTSTYLYDVAVDANGTVLVAANGGFFRSDDDGASFTQVATTPNYPQGVFAHGTTWYVALGSNGVAISQDGGTSWNVRGPAQGVPASARDVWFMPP